MNFTVVGYSKLAFPFCKIITNAEKPQFINLYFLHVTQYEDKGFNWKGKFVSLLVLLRSNIIILLDAFLYAFQIWYLEKRYWKKFQLVNTSKHIMASVLKFSGSWGQPGPEKQSEDSCAVCTLKQYLASSKTFKVRKSLLPFPDPCPLRVVSMLNCKRKTWLFITYIKKLKFS